MYSLIISISLVRPDGTTSAPFELRLPRWLERLWLKFDPLGLAIYLFSPGTFRHASRLYKEQRYAECISQLDALTMGGKAYPPALFRRGMAESKLGQWSAAHASISTAVKLWPWRRRWMKHLHEAKRMHQLLAAYRPQVILYLSGISGTAYQGNMWIPVLERLAARVAIVACERHIVRDLRETKLPVFYMTSLRELEILAEAGVRTVLYPANTQKNTHMMRFAGMNHFFINHGESDKVVNQSKLLMGYDKLLVAGPLAEKRLQDAGIPMRPGQVAHVGRPPVQLMLERPANLPAPIRTILYAPTWEGFVEAANYSSISEFGLALLQALLATSRWKIIFKPHPLTGSKKGATKRALREITELCNDAGATVAGNDTSIYDLMNEADLMITDISSTIPDFLYTLKPMILTNPRLLSHEDMHKTYPSSEATYILDTPTSAANLLSATEIDDFLASKRREVSRFILGASPEKSVETFNQIVNDSLAHSF